MRIMYYNEIDKNTITANSEDSGYPIENITDYQLAKTYRSTDVSSEWIKIDAGSGNTITATCIAILGHNLTSGATIHIQANATDSWTSPTIDYTVTYNSDIMTRYFTSASYRYWRFTFADSGNSDGYIEIGRLFLGEYLQFDDPPKAEIPLVYNDTSKTKYSLTGQAFGDEGIIYRTYNFIFPYWDEDTRTELVTMINEVKTVKPVVLIPDENNTDKLKPVYAVINDNLALNHIVSYKWNGTLSFREAK